MQRVYRDKLVGAVPQFPAQMEQNINDYLAAGSVPTAEFQELLTLPIIRRRLRYSSRIVAKRPKDSRRSMRT